MTALMPGWLVRLAGVAALIFLALPILIIFPLAFSPSDYLSFPPQGVSLRWFERLAADPGWANSLRFSVAAAVLATALSVAMALLAALALVRADFPAKRIVYAVVLLPMIVPHIITSIAVYFFFSSLGVSNFAGIVIGHAALAIPVATIILCATLQGFDLRLEQAALSLGASRFTALRRITLPMIAPGMVAAGIFAFLHSFDELLVAMFLSSPGEQTLPVRIWNAVQFQLDPSIAAVSAALIAFSVLALAVANRTQRKERA